MKDKPESIEDILVKDEMKYLRVNKNNTRNLFKIIEQKRQLWLGKWQT